MKAKQTICAALAVLALGTSAAAYQVPYTNGTFHVVTQETVNNDPEMQAEMLKKLGLFLGTNKGFELDRAMTRDEAAAMLTRFLGGAQEAASGKYTHPFTDVPDWANDSVGWLYQNKLTYGVSATKYGAKRTISADEFARFLSRALCGDDSMKDEVLPADEAKSFTARTGADGFRREDAVALSTRALNMKGAKTGGGTLAQALVEKGAFTAETFGQAAWDIYPPVYFANVSPSMENDRVVRSENHSLVGTLAGVPVVRTDNIYLIDASSADSELPYLYAETVQNGKMVYYQLDCRTLQETAVGERAAEGYSHLAYQTTVGGTDYLLETLVMKSAGPEYRLLAVKNGKLSIALEERELNGASDITKQENGSGLIIMTDQAVYTVDEDGIRKQKREADTEVIWTGESTYVTQTVTSAATTIANIDKATGKTLQSYTVPQDISGELRKSYPDTLHPTVIYGEAGLYEMQGDKLVQYYDRPALAYAVSDRFSSCFYVVTHDLGERLWAPPGYCGNRIVRIPYYSESEEITLWGSELGAALYSMEMIDDGYTLEVKSAYSVGMMNYDSFVYHFIPETGELTVIDFTAGYPELEDDFYKDPSLYKKRHVEAEQKRLDAIQSK